MSEAIQKIENMIQSNNGVITAAEVRSAGISPYYLSKLVNDGRLNRLDRGLYASPSVYVDEMFELFSKNRFIVFSHLSALYLHELTDRTPLKMFITVPRSKNVSKLLQSGIIDIKRSNEQTHELGLIQVPSPSGFLIPTYDIERTVCDVVKAKKQTDPQIFADALKNYAKHKDKNLTLLSKYAKILKTDSLLRPYLEVLL
ncbi:MAG: type IV toxin-antitoxin system AbiEi family antitoxin domain-containing protein [Oscillospiraceae bacterium]|nr:type IV toxin-antitoxin system AbiEi family antitoxin domain-containing protein [Oscillospiraceae bacterium]